MATYKVPQDVEAEDKLVAFLSLKQFIMVIIMFASLYMMFLLGKVNILLGLIPLPIAFISGMLGLYQRKDQPVEVFFASWLRFRIKPRTRKWDQEGLEERVIITVPRHVVKNYTNGLNEAQVSSRLNQLSSLMDSRGWASRQAAVPAQSGFSPQLAQPVFTGQLQDEERLLSTQELRRYARPTTTLDTDALLVKDVYDEGSVDRVSQEVQRDIQKLDTHRLENAQAVIDRARAEAAQAAPKITAAPVGAAQNTPKPIPAPAAPRSIAQPPAPMKPVEASKPPSSEIAIDHDAPQKPTSAEKTPDVVESDGEVTISLHNKR